MPAASPVGAPLAPLLPAHDRYGRTFRLPGKAMRGVTVAGLNGPETQGPIAAVGFASRRT